MLRTRPLSIVRKPTSLKPLLIPALQVLLVAHLLPYLTQEALAPLHRLLFLLGIAFASGVTFFSIWLASGHLEALRARAERWHNHYVAGGLLLVTLIGLIPTSWETPGYLGAIHLSATVAISLILLYSLLFDQQKRLSHFRGWLRIGLIAAVVITAIRIYSLTAYPYLDQHDEAWTLGWTLQFMRTGEFSDPSMQGLGDPYFAYPRFFAGLATWFHIFGVGLWQGRLYSFILSMLVIAFGTLAARNWYGERVALFTAIALFASAVLMSAARIRHDIGLGVCLAASLWLHTEAAKRSRPVLHLLAGIVMGWGMFSHYHAAGFGVAMAISLYLPRYLKGWQQGARLPELGFWLYGIGGLLGAATVLVLQIIPDDLQGFLWTFTRQSKFSNDEAQFMGAVIGHLAMIGFHSLLELILVVVGLIAALRRRRPEDLSLVLLFVLGHLMLSIMASWTIYYYVVPLAPVYAMLIATIFVTQEDTPGAKLSAAPARSPILMFAFLILPALGLTVSHPLVNVLQGTPVQLPPPPAAQWVLDNVPTHQLIAGDQQFFLWLYDYPYAGHHLPKYLYPEVAAQYPTFEDLWAAVDFDILIADKGANSYAELRPLVDSGFLQRHDYQEVARFGAGEDITVIYRRTAPNE